MQQPSYFDRMEAIDADRENPQVPPARFMTVTLAYPVTSSGTRYPQTCVVDVAHGRWPEWFVPFSRSIRRLQKRSDPNYGFVTERYSAFSHTCYVANDPGDGPLLYRRLMEAAKKAGWRVAEYAPGRQFTADALKDA